MSSLVRNVCCKLTLIKSLSRCYLCPDPGSYGPGEKRRKPAQLSNLTYNLEDNEILEDLKIINKNKAFSAVSATEARTIKNMV